MTVRPRVSAISGVTPGVISGAALSALALALTGCSSQGTIGTSAPGAAGGPLPGAASPTPAGPTSAASGTGTPSSASTDSSASSASAGSSATAPSSQDPSALASSLKTLNTLWTDVGCKTALAGFSTYLYAQQQGPAQGIAAIPGALPKIRAGAQQTKKPGAAQAITKMAADLQAEYSQAQQGKTPDKGPVKQDFQIMGNICSQP